MSDGEEEKVGVTASGEEKNIDVENANNLDENIYKQSTAIIDEGEEAAFSCQNPQNRGGHITYSCKGVDNTGSWEGERRFNEFFKLREKLEQTWPGIPIPNLPPKKSIGNKDLKFLNERRFYLERFLKKMSAYKFVLNSSEFQCFARPSSDVEKSLNALPKTSTADIVERLKKELEIDFTKYDLIQKDKLDNDCKEFQVFAKQMLPALKTMLKEVAAFMNNKSQGHKDYVQYLDILDKYEELNLANYISDNSMMVFGNSKEGAANADSEKFKQDISSLAETLKNPYFNIFHWIKGEIFDIESVSNSLRVKDQMQANIAKTDKKKNSSQKNAEAVAAGKKTVGTLFKNQGDSGKMAEQVEIHEKEIEALTELLDIMTIYIASQVIPPFKQKKVAIYEKIVQQYNVMQINNAHQVASFWSKVLENKNIKGGVES